MGLKNLYTAANKLNLRGFSIIPADYDISFFESSIGGSTAIQRYAVAETPDGVITDFTIPVNLVAGTDMVFVNGLAYNRGVMYQMAAVNTIRFLAGYIPLTGYAIWVTGVEDA